MRSNTRYKYSNPIWYQKYPLLIFLAVFILGILLHKSILLEVKELMLWSIFILSLIAGIAFHNLKTTHSFLFKLRILFIGISFFLLGNIADYYHDIRNNKNWYGHYLEDAEALQVRSLSFSEAKEKTILIPALVDGIYINGNFKRTIGEIKLYLYLTDSVLNINPESTLIIPNKIIAIKDSDNPFGFKYVRYLNNNNIYHQTFLSQQEIFLNKSSTYKIRFPANLREQLLKSIHKNINDSTTQSLVKATLLNDRTTLDNDLRQAYSKTGIAHIIAISGMHVSILFGVILMLLKWIKNKKLEWIKYFIAIPLVVLYIVITNFPPSAVRAAVMFILLALSIKTNRQTDGIYLLVVAAFILLFYNPNWIFDTGVQLSFTAVLSIFTFYQPIRRLWAPKWNFLTYFWDIVAVSLAAQVLVFPLVIFYFHQFPIWVLLANIPAAIYSVLLMCGALIIFVLDAVHIPCIWFGELLIMMTNFFHSIIYFLSENTPKAMQQFYLSNLEFWIFFVAIVLISFYFLKKKNILLFSGLGAAILLIFSFIYQDWHAAKQNKLVIYNISGTSVIDYIEGKKHKTLVQGTAILTEKNYQFNIFPAQLGLRSVDTLSKAISKNYWIINNKKILLVSDQFASETKHIFPIDYLILNNECRLDLNFFHAIFQPKKVILDGSIPRWKAQKWKTLIEERGLPVHWVQEDGAWVFGD